MRKGRDRKRWLGAGIPTLDRRGYLLARRVGLRHRWGADLYHFLVTGSWFRLVLSVSAFYFAAIAVFAAAFRAVPGSIAGGREGSFADAFFLSVQTFSTIGYGDLAPGNAYANAVVAVEMLAGLLTTAVATGLVFAKFARPTARLLFSRVAVIHPGPPEAELSFRVANERRNLIIDADIRVTLSRLVQTGDGGVARQVVDLPLHRTRAPFLALTWTVRHAVTPESPLHAQTHQTLSSCGALLAVSVAGTDGDLATAIHGQHVYLPEDIVWNARFRDVLGGDAAGRPMVDYSRFHAFEKLGEPALAPAPARRAKEPA